MERNKKPGHIGDIYSRFDKPVQDAIVQVDQYLREVVGKVRHPNDEPAPLANPDLEALLTSRRSEFGGLSIMASLRYLIEAERRRGEFTLTPPPIEERLKQDFKK